MSNEAKIKAEKIVAKMMDSDRFSQWLGISVVVSEPGHCILKMKIREEMVNGFGIAHGGIAFSFADSALAFASNAYGRLSVALECSISFPVAVQVNDELTCVAKELSITNKIATYLMEVKNQKGENVAFFKGTVYRTSKEWELGHTNNESIQIKKININSCSNDDTKNKNIDKVIFPELSYTIVGAAYEVYNNIGGGHKESVYQKALFEIFKNLNLNVQQQVPYQVNFKDKTIGKNYFDYLVENKIVVEIKSNDRFSKKYFDQVLNYLIVSNLKLGILLVFGREGVRFKRILNIDLIKK